MGTRRLLTLGAAATLTAVLLSSPTHGAEGEREQRTVTFVESVQEVMNPERGFHGVATLTARGVQRDLRAQRRGGNSLVRTVVRLDRFRTRPLTKPFLRRLARGFRATRRSDVKLVLRFTYNFSSSGRDASPQLIRRHLRQLTPHLRAHRDVIHVVQAGFIGAWGEWHTSTSGADRPKVRKKVLRWLLRAVPRGRMVQLRYPGDLKRIHPRPGSNSRVGLHNDCFLANSHDAGTYLPEGRGLRSYARRTARRTVTGGETCRVSVDDSRTECRTAVRELEEFGYDYLNRYFFDGALQQWRREGCFDEIERRLGYRLVLDRVTAPTAVEAGERLSVAVQGRNAGFSALDNRRPLYLVLSSTSTRRTERFRLQVDARDFAAARSFDFAADVAVPADLEPGGYAISLWLPDASSRLRDRPRTAVRFANRGTWRSATGLNRLTTLEVLAP